MSGPRRVGGAPHTERMAEREQFVERDLRGARFVECDLSDVAMRGVEVAGMDIELRSGLPDGRSGEPSSACGVYQLGLPLRDDLLRPSMPMYGLSRSSGTFKPGDADEKSEPKVRRRESRAEG